MTGCCRLQKKSPPVSTNGELAGKEAQRARRRRSGGGHRTDDCIRYEDVEEAVAVEVELEERRDGLSRSDGELAVAIGTAGHVDAVAQQVERAHDHVLRVPREAQVEIPRQDLLLHVEEVLHQLGEDHPLWETAGETDCQRDKSRGRRLLCHLQLSASRGHILTANRPSPTSS